MEALIGTMSDSPGVVGPAGGTLLTQDVELHGGRPLAVVADDVRQLPAHVTASLNTEP